MTTITNIPSFEIVQGWNVADVINFLESNNGYFSLNNTELGNIENSGFNGPALLDTNKDELVKDVGLRLGPAKNVARIVAQINDQIFITRSYGLP
ncbi:7339_t:CDS:2, partial [Funneliformis mosseae]